MNNMPENYAVHFMPDGRIAPSVLTPEEAAAFLRIEGSNPDRTLKYFRDEGELRGVIIGRRLRYRLEDIVRFLEVKSGGSAK